MKNGDDTKTARPILKKFNSINAPCIESFDTKIRALAFGDLDILSDLGRDIHTYVRTKKCQKNLFFWGFSESGGHETWRNATKFFDFWTDYHTFRSIERESNTNWSLHLPYSGSKCKKYN